MDENRALRMAVGVGAVVVVVAMALVGWAAWWAVEGRFAAARAEVQAVADRVVPGQVRVVSAEGRGTAGGYFVDAVLVDDPDASVGLLSSSTEDDVRAAVARARADAAELRALLGAFERCGLPPLGVSRLQRLRDGGAPGGDEDSDGLSVSVVVAADPAPDAGAALLAALDRCAQAHAVARDALPGTVRGGAVEVSVSVVDPGTTTSIAPAGPDRPRAQVLAEQSFALQPAARHRTTVIATAGGLVEPATRSFGPATSDAFAAALSVPATQFAIAAGVAPANEPQARPTSLYLPGTLTRVRAYVGYLSAGPTRPGDGQLLAVDVDTDASDPVPVRLLDDPSAFPPEPGLR